MPQTQLPITAACMCGACELRADSLPVAVFKCHCVTCQKTSGTDYQHNAIFGAGQLAVVKGQENIISVRLPGSAVRRNYCRICQGRVHHERFDPGEAELQILPVGLVTNRIGAADPAWQPVAHLYYGQRARDVLDGLPKWQGFVGNSERWQADAEAPEVTAAAAPRKGGEERPLPAPPIKFACHCGATELEATAAPLATYYCHCTSCQRKSGADFAHNAPFQPDQLRVTKGEDQLLSFSKQDSLGVSLRCGTCHDSVGWQREDASGAIVGKGVPVGIVVDRDNAAWQPRWHMCWSERICADMPDRVQKWSGKKDTSELVD